jgi:acetyltransferase-like isoleucine patch superfamily enzyme
MHQILVWTWVRIPPTPQKRPEKGVFFGQLPVLFRGLLLWRKSLSLSLLYLLVALKKLLFSLPLFGNLFRALILWLRENDIRDSGRNNVIQADDALLERCRIRFRGNENQLIFLPGASVKDCQIELIGDNHRLLIGENVVLTQSILWFEDQECMISIGSGTTMQRNGHIAVTEPGRKIEIGENCMFSFDVDIRNGDSHSIVEAATGKRVNWAKNISIGEHVWLGAYSQVLGGADIGKNAIIGIRSLVKGKVGEGVIAAGIPAKPIRSGFTWDSRRILDGDPGAL